MCSHAYCYDYVPSLGSIGCCSRLGTRQSEPIDFGFVFLPICSRGSGLFCCCKVELLPEVWWSYGSVCGPGGDTTGVLHNFLQLVELFADHTALKEVLAVLTPSVYRAGQPREATLGVAELYGTCWTCSVHHWLEDLNLRVCFNAPF